VFVVAAPCLVARSPVAKLYAAHHVASFQVGDSSKDTREDRAGYLLPDLLVKLVK
jgi:hypothetical protein